ncbi:MAG: hypothetical protein ACOC20_01215 [Oceanicaulis sp.]
MDAPTYSRAVHIRFEDGAGLLTVSFEGTVGRDDLAHARARLVETVGERAVSGVVLDARRSKPAYNAADLIESVELTLDDIAPKRCAFVSLEPRSEALMLIETVSFPYAVRVQAFTDINIARDWVLAAS